MIASRSPLGLFTLFGCVTSAFTVISAVPPQENPACPSTPAFVQPYGQFLDLSSPGNGDGASVDNNLLKISFRYPTGPAPTLVETSFSGATASSCYTFAGNGDFMGLGWQKIATSTRPSDGCSVDSYQIDLSKYLTSTANSNRDSTLGCGTATSGDTSLVTTIGHFNLLVTDTTTPGKAPAGQVEYNNPLNVKMVTPLSFTSTIAVAAAASSQFDANSLQATTYFTRQDLTQTGSLRIVWKVNTNNPYKSLAYDATPLSFQLTAGSMIGAISTATMDKGTTIPAGMTFTGEIVYNINNFCSGLTNAAGKYTLNFKTGTGNSNADIGGSLSFNLPTSNLCASFTAAVPTMELATLDSTLTPLRSELQLASTYVWQIKVNSVYAIRSVQILPDSKMVLASSAGVTPAGTTYNINEGSAFYQNQIMSHFEQTINNGYVVNVPFTVKNGETGPADWFFLNSEIPSTGAPLVKSFYTTFSVQITYADDQLNNARTAMATKAIMDRRADTTTTIDSIPNVLSANTTIYVTADRVLSSGSSRMDSMKQWMWGALGVVGAIAMF